MPFRSADIVADRHHDRDLGTGHFRWRRRQRRGALRPAPAFLVEYGGARAAHDAGVVHAATAVDAEGKLRDAVVAARLRFRRIALVAFELSRPARDFQFGTALELCEPAPAMGAAATLGVVARPRRRAGELGSLCLASSLAAFRSASAAAYRQIGSLGGGRFLPAAFRARDPAGFDLLRTGGEFVGTISGATGDGREIDHDHRRIRHQIGSSSQRASSAAAPATWTAERHAQSRRPSARNPANLLQLRASCAPHLLAASSPTSATCR